MSKPVHVEIDAGLAWVTIDNAPVNATSAAVSAGFLEALDKVQGSDLAVLRSAGRTFVAGGDMTESDAAPAEPHLPAVENAIEQSETSFLAILHGKVLGGGFEIALASAYRIAKPDTWFGLPEVNVGLIPGASERGGPMHWADAQGKSKPRQALVQIEQAGPNSSIRECRYQDALEKATS